MTSNFNIGVSWFEVGQGEGYNFHMGNCGTVKRKTFSRFGPPPNNPVTMEFKRPAVGAQFKGHVWAVGQLNVFAVVKVHARDFHGRSFVGNISV